jgi:two-component system, NarL family, nitrate/nitrite response regulator NarL
MAVSRVRVAILEDHQSIIDGYMYRLSTAPEIQVVGAVSYGENLEPLLADHPADVLLMDINVPASPENRNPFPVLHMLSSLHDKYPDLRVLAISVLTQNTLIEALIDAGVSGYIFKHDQASIQQLAKIVLMTASGGVYFSQDAYQKIRGNPAQSKDSPLTLRQMEILSICAAYPDVTTSELATRLGIASSTLRNLLSGAYLRLDVRTRAAAISKARQMGLLADSDSSDLKRPG